ncbi:hypothetical protein CHU98_g12052 [Xylaria longipes]|nr:hypothetical protein CHU98_g12052 [Xylaria longipes]
MAQQKGVLSHGIPSATPTPTHPIQTRSSISSFREGNKILVTAEIITQLLRVSNGVHLDPTGRQVRVARSRPRQSGHGGEEEGDSRHLEGVKPLAASGFIKTGGALLNEKPEGDDASKFSFYGSSLVCVASSKEEIFEVLRKDIYATTGVWDLDNVQIWPAKFAFRNP